MDQQARLNDSNNLSLRIAVSYCGSDSEGWPLPPQDFTFHAPYSTPLLESIRGELPSELKKMKMDDQELECFEGHSKGKKVKLDQCPIEIPFLCNAIREGAEPTLFLADAKFVMHQRVDTMDSGRGLSVSCRTMSDALPSCHSSASEMLQKFQDRMLQKVAIKDPDTATPEGVGGGGGASGDGGELERRKSFTRDDLLVIRSKSKTRPPPLLIQHDHVLQKIESVAVMSIMEKRQTMGNITMPSPPKTAANIQKTKAFTLAPGNLPQAPHNSRDQAMNISQPYTPRLNNRLFGFDIPHHGTESVVRRPKLFRRNAIMRRASSSFSMDLGRMVPQEVTISTESGDWNISHICDGQLTVGEFRALVFEQLSKKWMAEGSDPKQFILTYTVEGTTYELVKNSQFIRDSYFHEKLMPADLSNPTPPIVTVKYVSHPRQEDLRALFRVTQLIQVVLDMRVFVEGNLPTYRLISSPDQPEVALARRTLYEFVSKVTEERNPLNYSTSPEMVFSNTSISFSLRIPITNLLTIIFHYKDSFSLTKAVHINTSANKLLKEVFPCVTACGMVKDSINNYVLQVTGEDSYIQGDHRLIYFKDIRNFISKGEQIHLTIVKKPCQTLYQATTLDRLKIDPNSRNSASYRRFQDMKDPNCRASWDVNDKFKVKVCRVDNLGLRQSKVYVEVSLHFGCHPMGSVHRTPIKSLVSLSAIWNEELEFDIAIRDIPREAKLLVLLTDSASNILHWGLLTVFDHEGKLRCGEQMLHLWEENSMLFDSKYGPILAGPATNNPAPNAIKAVVALPDQKVFHLSSQKSRQAFMRSEGFKRNEHLSQHFAVYSIFKFVPPDSRKEPYSDLPKHLRSGVSWYKLRDRLEVHELLDSMQESVPDIPIHVALRLLDSDFPDSKVRKFATSILESLSDDNLYDYLLQLTQALKFEALHDSPLARFLLQRALNNKRIGHFFFWYLRCELQCPQYAPRLAVILESYLLGCGEAMQTRYKDQLEVQRVLERIGKQLKDTYDKDGTAMMAALPSALNMTNMDKRAFVPVTNPRLMLGMMRADKCKIMSSAKHPMWLELLNMSRSAITPTPVRLILKMGDDLRQDMMTLRMLALFDKLWKNEGLDLKLIPYGCMATSHNSGFIEVVKNANTIAEVSGVRETKKLYQWIRNNQRDEFGEVDSEKLEAAVQTFVHSCAGYSVATYTLGIGDRHNDNIMITTSGNLFHIDFGHFLGNIKYYMGFKKEWAPFVLTPDFVYAMGGENSKTFDHYRRLCCRAFMILRKNADLIINLFSMMRWTGIPELTCVEDTDYIRNALALDLSEAEAESCFNSVIKKCIDLGWTVQIMWAFHKLKHSKTS